MQGKLFAIGRVQNTPTISLAEQYDTPEKGHVPDESLQTQSQQYRLKDKCLPIDSHITSSNLYLQIEV